MPNDEQDKAGAVAPPPLIYLGILVFGLLLNRRFPTAFLPRTIARRLGWPLLSAGVLLLGCFEDGWVLMLPDPDTPTFYVYAEASLAWSSARVTVTLRCVATRSSLYDCEGGKYLSWGPAASSTGTRILPVPASGESSSRSCRTWSGSAA